VELPVEPVSVTGCHRNAGNAFTRGRVAHSHVHSSKIPLERQPHQEDKCQCSHGLFLASCALTGIEVVITRGKIGETRRACKKLKRWVKFVYGFRRRNFWMRC
jgi:hypothetical protein